MIVTSITALDENKKVSIVNHEYPQFFGGENLEGF